MDNVDLQSSYNLEWKGPLILQGNNGELFLAQYAFRGGIKLVSS